MLTPEFRRQYRCVLAENGFEFSGRDRYSLPDSPYGFSVGEIVSAFLELPSIRVESASDFWRVLPADLAGLIPALHRWAWETRAVYRERGR
jgi:hypothetical protein